MILHLAPQNDQRSGFTLAELLVSFFIFGLVVSGLIFGYVQVNRLAEFSSMSLAAQSYASQGLEQAKSAQWDYVRWPNTNYGPGTGDELGFPPSIGYTNLPPVVDTLDVPTSGSPIYITNLCDDHQCFHLAKPQLCNPASNPIGCCVDFPADGTALHQHSDNPAGA